jgi:hypothetical protein
VIGAVSSHSYAQIWVRVPKPDAAVYLVTLYMDVVYQQLRYSQLRLYCWQSVQAPQFLGICLLASPSSST